MSKRLDSVDKLFTHKTFSLTSFLNIFKHFEVSVCPVICYYISFYTFMFYVWMLYYLMHVAKGLIPCFAGFMILIYAAPSMLTVFGAANLPLVH